ncbi:ribonuclease HIII [Spiroplasma sp. BIUS-1]|uniref:ribonuclease HIII n=1 Tax=Spiroplasma sp. BIUS-1 TaxID=216964 RepID=UPI00139942A3|nr:ribonuclease HIII [Spiroplasma sp. BIUS-1]QHX36842.1 ribonuclease HIII [Spiroplasma sp. BIUS-1]
MNSLSIKKVDEKVIEKIVNDNKQFLSSSNNDKVKYFFKLPNKLVINIYNTNTILLQGEHISEFINKYDLKIIEKQSKEIKLNKNLQLPNIGCDEVGVGDFFGPLITCCAYVEKEFEEKWPELLSKITDSKKINDRDILTLFEQIKDKVIWEVYILENSKYNRAYDLYKNTHKLKAICHNQGLKRIFRNNENLKNSTVIMDQFVNEKSYYNYLTDQEIVIKDIYFETKAESKYISVACASIIARYHFLKEIERLEKEYGVKLPLGANNHVKEVVNKYKKEMPENVIKFTKMHFNSKI